MTKTQRLSALAAVFLSLSACSATQSSGTASAPQSNTFETLSSQSPANLVNASEISLELIMSDPDWIGNSPERPSWSLDGENVIYYQKQAGSELRDVFLRDPNQTTQGNGQQVELSDMHLVHRQHSVRSEQHGFQAWVFDSNLFVATLEGQDVRQLTQDSHQPHDLLILTDGRLAFRINNQYMAMDVDTGRQVELVSWRFAKEPKAVEPASDFIAREQLDLIEYVQVKRQQRQEQFDYQLAMRDANVTTSPQPFYLPETQRNVFAALSPKGDRLIVVTAEDKATRQDSDIMPNYIQEDGRIAADEVRRRVADATPESDTVWLIDIPSRDVSELAYTHLPGYNDDVLADVKRENAQARGEDYQVNRLPRDIGLLSSWYNQPGVQWSHSGDNVALQLEAWDNKDRWIVSVDFDAKRFVTQHRLSDNAWINYAYNQFGWLNTEETLFYLSEETGYSHLYVKPLDGKARALTKGQFVVDDVTFSANDQFAYFKGNVKHPGIYEIYRVDVLTAKQQALTDLNGMTDYVLSPTEDALLLTHSQLTMPPELYIQPLASENMSAKRLTHTVSDAFLALPWVAPSIVPVPSSHTDAPIFSRVYQPPQTTDTTTEKRRAVVFNHGAGYLQNSHMGWSAYFREFMFHSLLAHQGYVVMDMDYRASKGYGRDWRTAIYRQMGTPEVQDLVDGVAWMVENANVDRQRIGTYGGSYGGFMTFMALFTEPDLFQAGAALRPVSDWAHYNHPYTSNILNTPDIDPIAYRRSSPIYFAEGLQKPLLINAPMLDDNVFFVDVVRLVQRLIELEKENFETAIYPVEPHGFVQPSSWLDEYRRIHKLFEQNL
ncbi:S9 family peptidase [Alteromonas oceanisediminis]|uniref:S9 family peptidase n=1 Tax=Alteromonas oceanisediminis TaxID=2836180 RepID=UPI001BD96E71|nr:prolyl oligopeptidase family serine peptidase [Alteromonas oceanisediminis]MBT0586383.1 prolyl oligopeptidase family serine peptidase [Alteromonas oceanisediminis]